jgi:hypothetical protein
MCPHVDLPANLGMSVTPSSYTHVYTFAGLIP